MKIIPCLQRSPEWVAAHVGKLTGSCAEFVIRERKRGSGELEGRTVLRRRLVAERLTGEFADDIGPFLPFHMQRGVELEPLAFAAYEAVTGQLVERVGFVEHDDLLAGCSPDGYVGNFEGIIELKVPKFTTHLEYWQKGGVPEDYIAQVRHNLWVTGAQWCDFVSFDDRFKDPAHQLYRVRVTREEAEVEEYDLRARLFLAEVDRDYQIAIGHQWERAAALAEVRL